MSDDHRIDEPPPTRKAGGKPSIPQGIERLLALAGTNSDWRDKVLVDPLAAAREAKIDLSDSERNVLIATPHGTLEQMADSLAKRSGGVPWGKIAVGVSAAALLAAVTVPSFLSSSRGIRPDVPPPNPNEPEDASEAAPPLWLTSLDDAMAQARRDNQVVMAAFPHPQPPRMPRIRHEDGSHGPLVLSKEEKSQEVVLSDSNGFRATLRNAGLVTVRVAKPVPPFPLDALGRGPGEDKLFAKYEEALNAYQAVLKNYGIEEKNLPAIVFLAPNGDILFHLLQPQEEAQLVDAIKTVPTLLTKWYDEHPEFKKRDIISRPGVDVPLGGTAGIRIDIPPEKGN
jgi:hypothetical protein